MHVPWVQLIHDSENYFEQHFLENNTPSYLCPIHTFASVQLMCCFVAGIMLMEIVWLVLGVMWLIYHYHDCPVEGAKEAILGKEQCYNFNIWMCSLCGHTTQEW